MSCQDFWYERLYHEQQARKLQHEGRSTSVELLATGNRPHAVVDLNKLRDNVYQLLGVTP